MRRLLFAAFAFPLYFAAPSPALAFGLVDVLSGALQVGAKIGSAAVGMAVDSAKEAMRDPEEEKRKQQAEEARLAEDYRKATAEIEAKNELSPLQRERLLIQFKDMQETLVQMRAFIARTETAQRAERDRIFTPAGLLGATVEAAANSPSLAMKKADQMVKDGIPQRQTREAMARFDAGKQKPSTSSAALLSRAIQPAPILALPTDVSAANALMSEVKQEHASAQTTEVQEEHTLAFSPDKNRKIHLEFIGAPSLTRHLFRILQAQGYILTNTPSEADVRYRFEGDLLVPESSIHAGLRVDAGSFLENPQFIPAPEKKTSGQVKSVLRSVFLGLAKAQGANLPAGANEAGVGDYAQDVVIVASRHADGFETRISSRRKQKTTEVGDDRIIQMTAQELFELLGLSYPERILPVTGGEG
jgi:hypothetical protein